LAKLLPAFFIAIFLVLVGERAYAVYQWKVSLESRLAAAESRLANAEQAFVYLSTPVLTLPDGTKLSRAQLLDLIQAKAVKPESK
jgi:hypothetical protein